MIKVLHYVSVMDRGGQETFIMNVYNQIDRGKIQFDFLCSLDKKGDYDDEIKSLGGKIINMDISKKGGKFTKYYFNTKDKIKFLSKIAKDYDIIHMHNHHAFSSYLDVYACKKAGFKNIILHSHNTSAQRAKLHKIFVPMLERQKNITRYACSSEAGRWLHGKCDFDVIFNGIDTKKFAFNATERERLRNELGLKNNFVIGMVGRFNFQKNHLFALDVFKDLVKEDDTARLVLVGKGELEKQIKEKIRELNLQDKVIFLGTRNDVNKLMSAFDVLFMPSLFEGLSVVLIESQYCNLPCVASRDCMAKEIKISNSIDFVDINGNMGQIIKRLLDKKDVDRESCNIQNDNFDINNVAKDLQNRYEEISKL